jgi:MFS family permease
MLIRTLGIYLISFWYKREESQKRFTFFWCSIIIAGAFGGLLASAIANMNGVRGLKNWRWIFILEGTATILIGIFSYFVITDFPDQARWLTDEERELIRHRTGCDDSAAHQSVSLRDVGNFFKDPKNILGAFIYWGTYEFE